MSSGKLPYGLVKLGFLLVATLSQTHWVQASPSEFVAEDYAQVVQRYIEGQFRSAVRELSDVSPTNLEKVCEEYGERWLTVPQLKAAALLHTEAVLFEEGDLKFHTSAARRWLRRAEFGFYRNFERRLFLLMSYHFMGTGQPWETRAVLEAALLEYPEDREFVLALGTLFETSGWVRKDAASLRKAEDQYRLILDKDPGFAEARLRLGRVLALLGRADQAFVELNGVLSTTKDKQFRLVGHLAMGAIHEEREELEEAVEAYRRATALNLECQSASIALAHALHRAGDLEGSLWTLEKFLERDEGGISRAEDPWLDYLLGHSHRFGELLRDMRAEVR